MKFKITSVKARQEYYSSRKGEPYRERNKAYIWISGESILENLENRRSRPYKYFQENVLPLILREIADRHPDFKISTNPKDWGWRQKCGCSCPCSPGFIQKNSHDQITISAEVEFFQD